VDFRLASGKRSPRRAVVRFGIDELEPRRRRLSRSPSVGPGQAAGSATSTAHVALAVRYTPMARCMSGPAGDRVQEAPLHIAVAHSIARTGWSRWPVRRAARAAVGCWP
jgi:hypothetical protein